MKSIKFVQDKERSKLIRERNIYAILAYRGGTMSAVKLAKVLEVGLLDLDEIIKEYE